MMSLILIIRTPKFFISKILAQTAIAITRYFPPKTRKQLGWDGVEHLGDHDCVCLKVVLLIKCW